MKYNLIKNITKNIIDETREYINSLEREITDAETMAIIEEKVFNEKHLSILSACRQAEVIDKIFYTIRSDLNILKPLVENDTISEIMVNGPKDIFVEQGGQIKRVSNTFDSTEEVEEVIRRIAASVHREINELSPILDARLSNGSRVNAVYKNISINGPTITIRKFPEKEFDMKRLIEAGTITEEGAMFLYRMVHAGYNIFISGGTSSGKTTFLNALSRFIPREERVIVIEDSAELQVTSMENVVRLECRNANIQGVGEVNMEALIKTSLRMRPDRIIVGEVRGRECFAMLQAMNTGHDGSMSTGHANSIDGMLRRLEAMYLQAVNFPLEAIRAQIVEGIDIIVHLGRLCDGSRKVLEIAEIQGIDDGKIVINSLFKYKINNSLLSTGNVIQNKEKMELREIEILP